MAARSSTSGADDYRMLLTVIAGIALGVAATALPRLIEGPYLTWSYATHLVMWFTGIAAGVLEYLAVSFGSRLYLVRVEAFATAALVLVFLAQAGLFVVMTMGRTDLLAGRWFALFAIFCTLAGLEAEHARRMVLRSAGDRYDAEVVALYARSLRQVVVLILAAGLLAVVFASTAGVAPDWLVFFFSLVAAGAVAAAHIQQQRGRNTLAERGVLPGR